MISSRSPSIRSKFWSAIFPPNVRLRLTLHIIALDDQMQRDLARLLGSKRDFPHDKHQLDRQYNRYVWDLKVKNSLAFKDEISKYKQSHPHIDLYVDDINSLFIAIRGIVFIIGGIAATMNIINYSIIWLLPYLK